MTNYELPRRELRSPILLQYLQQDFSQDLFHRQLEVDDFWSHAGPLIAAYEDFLKNPGAQAAWERKLDENLPLVRQLLGNDITSLRDDDNVLRIYERVFAMAQRRISSWGGKIFLVMFPNNDTYFSGAVPKYSAAVNRVMRKLAIQTIDLDQALRAAGDPLQFYPRAAAKEQIISIPEAMRWRPDRSWRSSTRTPLLAPARPRPSAS